MAKKRARGHLAFVFIYAYTHFHTHAITIWLRQELREHSSLTLACNSTFFLFCQIYYNITFNSSNSQTSQGITNIFKYSNILHQMLDIRIRILNFLVTNIFDIRIRPIRYERIYSIFVFGHLLRTNIFGIRIRWNFPSRIYSYLYSVKNLIFVLHWKKAP